jgi:hypothetical protein
MLDASLPEAPAPAILRSSPNSTDQIVQTLPERVSQGLKNPDKSRIVLSREARADLREWKRAVNTARIWCGSYAERIEDDPVALESFQAELSRPDCPLPSWIAWRLNHALQVTEKVNSSLRARQAKDALVELHRRLGIALERVDRLEIAITKLDEASRNSNKKTQEVAEARISPLLFDLHSVTGELVSLPEELMKAVVAALDASSLNKDQLITMFRECAVERKRMEQRLNGKPPGTDAVPSR